MDGEQARYLDPKDWSAGPCWQVRKCPAGWKAECPAWQYEAVQECWEISGTFCQGKFVRSLSEKRKLCCQCEVYRSTLAPAK